MVIVTLTEQEGKQVSETKANVVQKYFEKEKLNLIYEAEILVQNPRLWWPNGYGEQPLYTLMTSAYWNDKRIQCETKTIGLRTLTISQEAAHV